MRILAVTNMYPTPRSPSSGIFVEQQVEGLRQIGLDVALVFVERLEKGMAAYLGLGRRIRTAVESSRPDVVHVMYGGVMAAQVTKAVESVPVVVTFHGSDLLGERAAGSVRRAIAGYGVRASGKAARRARGVVVVSRVLQEALPKDVDRARTRIIPCGIDLRRFTPLDQRTCRERLGWDPDRFHVLFPSQDTNPVKRAGLARAAVESLNRLGVAAEMHCLSGVPNADVPVWLNASDVVLLTSLHEGSPTIVKEALACDRPVVSVDVGDVRERIREIRGCYLATPERDSLAAALCRVRSGPSAVAGRIRMQELSLRSVALRLEEFYTELLNCDGLAAPESSASPVAEAVL